MAESLTIGELAKRGDVGVETVRYYERRGLMPEPPRNGAGYRLYSQEDVERLRFIRGIQHLGFTLNEIQQLLELRALKTTCDGVHSIVSEKLSELTEEVTRLEKVCSTLHELLQRCPSGGTTQECELLAALEPGARTLIDRDPIEK